jgi:CheY-like chemotaxis protein
MSGIDLAMELKMRRPECKILLFSGQAATANLLEEARSKGHDFALLLPIHPKDLLTAMRKLSPPNVVSDSSLADLR